MALERTDLTGALLVDKPAGPTSHDIVAVVRRALKIQRIGHTGTLDPLATGLLVLLIGPATRLAQFVATDEKEYIADVRLGIATPTYDAASRPDDVDDRIPRFGCPSTEQIEAALAHFRGTFMQTPPQFSAKKREGVPAHERARRQQSIVLAPVEVTVRELERLEPRTPDTRDPAPDTLVRLRIVASAGFYVRSLAHDLGQQLGCGAHLERLRRVRAGRLSVADALSLDTVINDAREAARRIIPPGELLKDLPAAALNARGLARALHGNPLGPEHLNEGPQRVLPGTFVRLFDGQELVGVGAPGPDGSIQPVVVLVGAPEVKY